MGIKIKVPLLERRKSEREEGKEVLIRITLVRFRVKGSLKSYKARGVILAFPFVTQTIGSIIIIVIILIMIIKCRLCD